MVDKCSPSILSVAAHFTATLFLFGAGYVATLLLLVFTLGHVCTLGRREPDGVHKGLAVGCVCSGNSCDPDALSRRTFYQAL